MATAPEGYDHDYLNVWRQGVLAGQVVDHPDRDHPVSVTGFVWQTDLPPHAEAEGMLALSDQFGRAPRPINRPVFISLAHAKALLDRYAGPDAFERLIALNDVATWANWYRMEVI